MKRSLFLISQCLIRRIRILQEMLASISVEEKQAGNKLAKKICKVLFESEPPKRQELFARGRMAYLVDLDDEESEVPSTLLRSVYDTQMDQSSENIGTDNLLISVSHSTLLLPVNKILRSSPKCWPI